MNLKIENVYKEYKSFIPNRNAVQALKNINLTIENGTILALIGQNGAGKTTLIKCILGFLSLDNGSITINGKDIKQVISKSELGYMPDNVQFPEMLKLEEYISDLLVLRGKNFSSPLTKNKYENLIDKLHVRPHISKYIGQYSKGTKKKVSFIQAVIHSPRLLILDEPTDGLDPVSRRALLNQIVEIKKSGGIVIITTHLLSDLMLVADRVVVMMTGEIIKDSLIEDIGQSLDDWYLNIVEENRGY